MRLTGRFASFGNRDLYSLPAVECHVYHGLSWVLLYEASASVMRYPVAKWLNVHIDCSSGRRGGPEPAAITLEAFGRDIPEA